MDTIKFYSEQNMGSGAVLNSIIDKINKSEIAEISSVIDLIEFHNVLKYFEIERFLVYIETHTSVDCKVFEKGLRKKIGQFLNSLGGNYVKLYDDIDFYHIEDFLEIIEKYKLFERISDLDFSELLDKSNFPVYFVFRFRDIIDRYDSLIKDKILNDFHYAESILSKYLGEEIIYFPPSLSKDEMLNLIDGYLSSSFPNINYLRSIIEFPSGRGLEITDRIKLHAKRKESQEKEKLFRNGGGITSSISISYPPELNKEIVITSEGLKIDIKVSRKWIEENKDYPTLWNNFIYLFGIVDNKFRLTLTSKTNGMSAIEYAIAPKGKHLYKTSTGFDFLEMMGNIQVNSYLMVMSAFGIRIEDMIEWFFKEYLKIEFSINNFIVRMPSKVAPYFEKCRSVLPELDRIFKQYNVLIEDGVIDQELIQLSSFSYKHSEVKSFIENKYVYPVAGWYNEVSFLLFSDQSGIFYLRTKKGKYRNFYELIKREEVKKSDFLVFQQQKIEWLFENNIIVENENGYIDFVNLKAVSILKELYNEDVLSYFHYSEEERLIIDEFMKRGYVTLESSLLSRNEQDYYDFYLNKAKFTNGYDLRNRYLHGTNTNDENQYKSDYYLILKLLIIVVIKINDDLCLQSEVK